MVSKLRSKQNLAQNILSKYQLPSPFLILASRDRLSGVFVLGQLSHRGGVCAHWNSLPRVPGVEITFWPQDRAAHWGSYQHTET